MVELIMLGTGALIASLLLGSDDDKVKRRSNHDDIERIVANNQAVISVLLNYQCSEITRIQSKYNVQIYLQNGGFGFENVALKNLESEHQKLKNEIKRLQGLKNALE